MNRATEMDSPVERSEQRVYSAAAAEQFTTRTRRLLIFATILIAAAYAFTLKGDFTYVDEADYYFIASNILQHHTFSRDGVNPTASRPPGYPATLVPVLALHDSVRFAKAINLLWWIGAAFLTSYIAGELYGSGGGTLALLFVLFYPVSLYTAGTLYPQGITSFFFLVSIAVHFRPTTRTSLKEAFLQGLVFSFLIVSVPLYAANLAIFMAFQVFETDGVRKAIVTFLVAAFAVGLWSLRNYSAFGQFTFASNSGVNLLLGNSPLTGPNSGTNVDVDVIAPEALGLPEVQRDAALKKHAVDWIKGHPREFGWLFVKKFANWFNYRNQLRTSGESSGVRDLAMAVSYYPLLALALLLPVVKERRLTELERYLYSSYGAAALAYALFFTRIRFRVPFDYLVIILASGSASILLHSYRVRTANLEAPAR